MAGAPDKTIEAAQSFLGKGLSFERLDQVFDLQRLLGPVIAYKILLEIAINAADVKERRLAASQLLQSTSEDPETIADRLRASLFYQLSLKDLEAIVQSGITDPEEAARRLTLIKVEEAGTDE